MRFAWATTRSLPASKYSSAAPIEPRTSSEIAKLCKPRVERDERTVLTRGSHGSQGEIVQLIVVAERGRGPASEHQPPQRLLGLEVGSSELGECRAEQRRGRCGTVRGERGKPIDEEVADRRFGSRRKRHRADRIGDCPHAFAHRESTADP